MDKGSAAIPRRWSGIGELGGSRRIVELDTTSSDVLGQMLARPGAGDKKDVRCQVEQPRERDLGRSRAQPLTQLGNKPTRKDLVLNTTRPAQRAERHEGDAARAAFVQDVGRA